MRLSTRWVGLCLAGVTLGIGCGEPTPDKSGGRAREQGRTLGDLTAVLSVGAEGKLAVEGRGHRGVWRPLGVGHALRAGERLRTPQGVRARLSLGDGSVLHINEATEVGVARRDRLRLRRGELLAEVRPKTGGSAVVVSTPAGEVRITGTKVNLRARGDRTYVDVARGTVEVVGAGKRIEVGAGEQAVVERGGAPRVRLSRDLVQVTGWAREVEPGGSERQLEAGFGSLKARVPGGGKSRALRLARHEVRVTVRDNIARTEIEQTFENASGQTLEGIYRFPLPAGASISRLALYVGQRLEEGEIVERRRARRIFAKIVNDTIRPRDPALLEWVGGRIFRMRIFPIPPRSKRRVILAYTESLAASYGRYQYVYPLATGKGQATRVGRFSVEMRVSSSGAAPKVRAPLYPVSSDRVADGVRLRYRARDFVPAASFVVDIDPSAAAPEMQIALFEPKSGKRRRCALRDQRACGDQGGFFMARLRPELPTRGRARPNDLLFLLDSSHSSGKRGWGVQLRALAAFFSQMDLRSRFNLLVCDASCRRFASSFQRPTAAVRRRAMAFARKIAPGGSSNIQAAFEDAAQLAANGRRVRVIYCGDGRPTAGEMREAKLAQLVVERLRGRASLSVLQVGDDAAAMFFGEATRRLGGAVYQLSAGGDVRRRVFEIVAAQYRPTLGDLEIRFTGEADVHHVYPGQPPTLTAGSELVLVGRYSSGGRGAIKLAGRIDGKPFVRSYPFDLTATAVERRANRFVPRLWARHHLAALSAANHRRNRAEIVRVSKAYTVLSRATAFLVLENEKMYREFGVRRNRQRGYWRGRAVASRDLRDAPEAAGAKKTADLDALLGGSGTRAGPPVARGAKGMRPKRKQKAGRRRIAPRKSVSAPARAFGGGLRGRTARKRPSVLVRRSKIVRLAAVAPRAALRRRIARLAKRVARAPLRRSLRRAYHRALVRAGRYAEALTHARRWAELDGDHPAALGAVAEMQAATGARAAAQRSMASRVDVRPWSIRLHRELAAMYRRKGDWRRSCAHRWAMMSIAPQRIGHHLRLARCLAHSARLRPQATEVLTQLAASPLGRRHAARVGRALAALAKAKRTGSGRARRPRGALVVTATWDRPADLDLAVVLPNGRRLSPLRLSRQGRLVDGRGGAQAEALVLRWARDGRYRVEVERGDGGEDAVSGTLTVRAGGRQRRLRFTLGPRPHAAVARVNLRTVRRYLR